MEQLVRTYGATILNVVGGIAIFGFMMWMVGIGLPPKEHTFTEAEVGTVVELTDSVSLLGHEYVPAIKYTVTDKDVGDTVSCGRGVLGEVMYIVFHVMLED